MNPEALKLTLQSFTKNVFRNKDEKDCLRLIEIMEVMISILKDDQQEKKKELPRWISFMLCNTIDKPKDILNFNYWLFRTTEMQSLLMMWMMPRNFSDQQDMDVLATSVRSDTRYKKLGVVSATAALIALCIPRNYLLSLVKYNKESDVQKLEAGRRKSGRIGRYQNSRHFQNYRRALLTIAGMQEEVENEDEVSTRAVQAILTWCEGTPTTGTGNPYTAVVENSYRLFRHVTIQDLIKHLHAKLEWRMIDFFHIFRSRAQFPQMRTTYEEPDKCIIFPACGNPCTPQHITSLNTACSIMFEGESWTLVNIHIAQEKSECPSLKGMLGLENSQEPICDLCSVLIINNVLLERRQSLAVPMGILKGAFSNHSMRFYPSAHNVCDGLAQMFSKELALESVDVILGWLHVARGRDCSIRAITNQELDRIRRLCTLILTDENWNIIPQNFVYHLQCAGLREKLSRLFLSLFSTENVTRIFVPAALEPIKNMLSLQEFHRAFLHHQGKAMPQTVYTALFRCKSFLQQGMSYAIIQKPEFESLMNYFADFITFFLQIRGLNIKRDKVEMLQNLLIACQKILLNISIPIYAHESTTPGTHPEKLYARITPKTTTNNCTIVFDAHWIEECKEWILKFQTVSNDILPRVPCGKEFLIFLLCIECTAYQHNKPPEQIVKELDYNSIYITADLGVFLSGGGMSRGSIGGLPASPDFYTKGGVPAPKHQILPFSLCVDAIKDFHVHPLFYAFITTQPLSSIRPVHNKDGNDLEEGEIIQGEFHGAGSSSSSSSSSFMDPRNVIDPRTISGQCISNFNKKVVM